MKKHLFLSVFSVFFALFGGVGVAHAANYLPECKTGIFVGELDGNFEGAAVKDADISGFDMRVYLLNSQTMHTIAFCSDGDTSSANTPDESTGKFCWCGLDGYTDADGHTSTSSIPKWVFITDEYSSYSDCEDKCASACLARIRKDPSDLGKLCLTFKEECEEITPIGKIDDAFYGATPLEPTVNSPNWELGFDGGQVVYGTSFCSFTDNDDFRVPSTVAGQHCWCGIRQHVDGNNNTYNSIPETWWYQGEMSDTNTCNDECASVCAAQYGTKESRIQIGEEIGICYNSSTPYNVTYVCGNGISHTDPTSYFPGDNVTALGAGRCGTPPNGYSAFNNWSCNNNVGTISGGGTFTMPAADVTCTAQWTPNIYTIRLLDYNNTSTYIKIYEKYNTGWYKDAAATQVLSQASRPTRSGYTFRGFYTTTQSDLTASGGSGTRVITQTGGLPANNTFTANTDLYAAWAQNCSAGTGCKCTLSINSDGTATYTTTAQSGYTLTSGSGTYAPVCSAINYTVSFVPGNGGASGNMSSQTGKHIGDTITLPANGFTAPSGYVFNGWSCNNNIGYRAAGSTFTMPSANVTCTAQWLSSQYPFSLTTTTLDDNQFTFNMSAKGTFYVDCGTGGTLSGTGVSGNTITRTNTSTQPYTCTYASRDARTIRIGGLATEYHTDYAGSAINFGVHGNYVASISGDLSQIFPLYGTHAGEYPSFYGTFSGCVRLTSIPDTLFSGYTTGGEYMFKETFAACIELTSLPSGLFSGITSGAPYMFNETFYACSSLTSLPSSLFSGITSGASNMFTRTFGRCSGLSGYIPSTLFAGLISNNSPDPNHFMDDIFMGTSGLDTSCPSGMTEYTTGYESYWVDSTNNVNWPTHYVSCVAGQPSNTYTVSFAAGDTNNDGTGTAATGSTAAISNQSAGTSITLPASTFTAPSGYTFNGWSCNQGIGNKAANEQFTMPASDVTCTAQWAQQITYPFTLTTTSLSANSTFQFTMSAQGTFYVDCGDGGTLSGPSGSGVSGDTITKSDTTSYTYTCTYSSAGAKTIQFGGAATGYSNSPSVSVIRFTSPTLVDAISGDLSQIFPESVSLGSRIPRFISTFQGCSNLVSIPDTLFSQYTKTGQYMFEYTFKDCTGLTSIPSGLFGNVSGAPAGFMFSGTFSGCSNLSSFGDKTYVPGDFLANIDTNTSVSDQTTNMFYGTQLNNPCPANTYASTRQQFNNAGKPWCTECPSGATSPAGSTSASECVVTYNITYYDSDCSTVLTGLTPTTYTDSDAVVLATPTRTGYKFNNGWCSSCGSNCGFHGWQAGMRTGNQSIYMNPNAWTPNIYTIRLFNYNNTSTHIKIYEKYNTGWYKDAAATQVLSQASQPTRSGYTFRGFYTATQSDLTASGGSGTRVIDASGTLPANTTFTANTDLYAAWARSCNPGAGCTCNLVVNDDGTVTYQTGADTGYTLTSGSGTYAPVCTGNSVSLTWDGGGSPSACTYGGTFVPPTPTPREGYVFTGWKMCSLSGFNASINGTENGSISGNGNNSLNAEIYELTDNGTFATKFSYATLYGESRCSATRGNTQGEPGIPSESTGQYCWCGVTKFQTPGMQSQCELSSINWVYNDYHENQAECSENCAGGCGFLLQVSSTVRAVAFGQ